MDKFETSWMTFTLAILVIGGAVTMKILGDINVETMKWLITAGLAAYTARTVANKLGPK
jgi:hypothetical protein